MTTADDKRNDRDDVLGAVDLAALLDQLGAARGIPRRRKWRPRQFVCPSSSHAQTGASPPATVKRPAGQPEWWCCNACGAGGTAIDALIAAGDARDVGQAFRMLRGEPRYLPVRRSTARAARDDDDEDPTPEQITKRRRALGLYLAGCHDRLRRPAAAPIRQWLHERGFTDQELAFHGVGYDPGYQKVWRPKRQLIPTPGPAITLPLFGTDGSVIHAQARVLDEDSTNKYLNPARTWIGPNPRIGMVYSPPTADFNVVVVSEGLFDAYVAARHFATFGMTGAKLPEAHVAQRLAAAAAGRPIVVCLDPDTEGYRGALLLIELLRDCGATTDGVLLPGCDINDLYLADRAAFPRTFCPAVLKAADRARRRGVTRFPSPPRPGK